MGSKLAYKVDGLDTQFSHWKLSMPRLICHHDSCMGLECS